MITRDRLRGPGFGYSRDAMGEFGPPKFDDAALAVPAGPVSVVMHPKYM